MKKLLLLLFIFLSGFVYAQNPETLEPSNSSYVNDFGNVFSESQRQELDAMMRSFHDTAQITIVTVNSLNGLDRAEYATKLGNKWGVGSHSDDGLLILICVPEHQFFAATGKGIQGEMTDLKCGKYYDELAKPKYKEGDYFGGTRDVLSKYIEVLSSSAREYSNKQEKEEATFSQRKTQEALSGIGYFLFIIIVIVLFLFGVRRYIKKKEEKEVRDRAVKEQEIREFNKTKDRYLICYGEVQKLNETLNTSPFKTDVDKIRESLGDLILTVFVDNPTKEVMESYIEKYNERLKGIKTMIEDVNKKTSILTTGKNLIDKHSEALLQKNNQLIIDLEKALKQMVFNNASYENTLKILRDRLANIGSITNSMIESYKACDIVTLVTLSDELNKNIDNYQNSCTMLRSVLDEDAGRVRIANTGKDTLLKHIADYKSYCGKQGVSAAANNDTKQNCEALLEQVNHQFSNDIVTNYSVYNALSALLPNLCAAKKEYDAEQARLQKIKDEEERKRKEEERKRREIEEEEERKRRKKQQEEDDARRRRDDDDRRSRESMMSSMNSMNNSSSSGSTGFGGGTFDGSGGGSSW